MSSTESPSLVHTKNIGPKKQVLDNKSIIDNIRDHEISKSFAMGNICYSCELVCKYYIAGIDLNARDSKTGETFLHVLTDYTHLYLTANGTRIMYMLSTKLDIEVPDENGDTVLHKVVRVPGAWRCIVALMRCGACPLRKNKAGRTPEDEILHLKNTGWEENLHWLRKYHPGLWAAVKSKNPDPVLIERLLRYWCRTVKVIGRETANLKCQVHLCETQLDTVMLLEKYENTNEMALSMLSGKLQFVNMWKAAEQLQKVDINTKDFSYQFFYRDYPTAPRPLLAAVWEINQIQLINAFMELNPDTSVKYTFESEAASPPKPLFFQLVNPKCRPQDESITARILRDADLNIRNIHGQTVLVEAMCNGESEAVVRAILNNGVNVAARDAMGRTARDHCDILKRPDYKELIDSHVLELIQDCDIERLEALVLQLYGHIIPEPGHCNAMSIVRQKCSKQLYELIKNIQSTQAHVMKLFALVKTGNKAQLIKHMSRKYANARDKAGRTLLHCAIQHSQSQPVNDNAQIGNGQRNSTNSHVNGNRDIIFHDINLTNMDPSNTTSNSDTEQLYNQQDTKSISCRGFKKECTFKSGQCSFKRGQCWKRFYGQSCNPASDYIGIIRYLVQEYPFMLGHTNNFGQNPLHYVYIYSASKEIQDLIEKTGSCALIKDVYDFVPEDYDRSQCGEQTFKVRRRPTVNLDLDIFLTESNFEERFHQAIKSGNLDEMKKLVPQLLEHNGESRFSQTLFDCLDTGHVNLAQYLAEAGFHTDISKQYEICDPDDPMCAMMECSHAVTTFKQRALDVGATNLVKLIDDLSTSTQLSVN
ncbi:unnamed protein product [Lymnaea stagnalis]|uniref:Uncharacterized protein n=1 Tax=Lymnaea stagnalis TaxID=6523 RepID=A0AAV2HGL5_LYMST